MRDSEFFSASQVIEKEEFLRLYRTVNAVSNLLLAPFGFSNQFHLVIDEDRIVDEYTPVFQQIEDVVAKVVFRHFGYDDDRIIASMHQYIGIEQDKQLLQEIKSARQILTSMIERPAVVDFDFPQLEGEVYKFALFNDIVAKDLFERVQSTLQSVASFTYLDVNQNDVPQKFTIGLERDAILHRAYGINVLKRMPSPILCLSNLLDVKNAEKVKSIVESILNSFILPSPKTPEANLSLSQEQIHVLLDIYWNPSEINNDVSLEEIRMGFGSTDIQAFRHPLGQFILQLSSVMIESSDNEEGDDEHSLPGVTEKPRLSKHRYRDAVESLAFVTEAFKKLDEAKNVMSMGDPESAAETLGEGCLDLLDFELDMNTVLAKEEALDDMELVPTDSDEEESHTPKGTHIIIPIALQVELLLTRAKYLLESSQLEAALVDIQRAIDCDCSSSAAYALRAQVRLALIQRGQVNFPTEADEEEEDENVDNIPAVLLEMVDGDASLISEQDIALHKAAADAMIGFLLSGSSDVTQASLAEELAKETVRNFSRSVFHNRRLKLQEELAKQSIERTNEKKMTAPKPWLIGSYLSSYPLLSKSLHLAGARTAAEVLRRQHWQKTQENDIDESDYKQEHQTEIMWEYLPPDHLLDKVEGETAPVVRDQDVAAYDLLVQLSDLLESFAFGDAAQPLPAHLADNSDKIRSGHDANEIEDGEDKQSQVDFSCNAMEVAVESVSNATDLTEDPCFIARKVDNQSVLSLCPLSVTIPNNWRIVQLGKSSFSPLSESDILAKTENDTKQGLEEEENSFCHETNVEVSNIMSLARQAATLVGVKLDVDSFAITGFEFELKPIQKSSSSSSSSYGNNYNFDSFCASKQAHDYFFNDKNDYNDEYGHNNDDDNENGEDEWEDCDEVDEEEEDEPERVDKNEKKEYPKASNDTKDKEGDDEDFERLASMIGRVDLSRGGSLTSNAVSEMGEAFPNEGKEGEKKIENDEKNEIEEKENKTDAQLNTEDIDISIDELIDALKPLTTEEQEEIVNKKDNDNNDEKNSKDVAYSSSIVSNPLCARLLNIIASLAYLVGDSVGASKCFQASLQYDATLHDSRVKLGALYVDLDEPQKAYDLLSESLSSSSGDAAMSSVSLLHLGQWALNESDFSQAADFLRRANRLLQMSLTHSNAGYEGMAAGVTCLSKTGHQHMAQWVESVPWQERCDLRQKHAQTQIHSNVYTLLAVATFRQSPTDPEFAVSVMKEGLNRYPSASSLMLCGGEILSQAGDMVKGLEHFRNVSQLPAYRALPLPYVSAARVYQQLGQLHKAHVHLSRAIHLDDTLAMTLVDLSQLQRQEKHLDKAVQTIDQAMQCAKQVSEIRDVLSTKYLARLQQSMAEKYHLDMSVLNNNSNANQNLQ